MLNIDYITLNDFFEENIDFFIGARVQKIQQPTRKDFIFSMRNNGTSRKFYININPQFYHVSFISQENEKKRNIQIPKQPPMFCMLLRKYLEGCKISDAKVIKNERIFELHFEIMDELSQRRFLCLCIELMGKHSNVILYDRETNIIIGCAHNVGPEKSRYRELQGGIKYIYPPKTDKFLNFDRKPLYEFLQEQKTNLNINELLDDYFSNIQCENILKSEKEKLNTIVLTKLKKTNSAIDKISTLLKKRDNTEKYKLFGELLTANLYQKKDYSSQIEVLNYFTGENIVIELDATKTLNENAQKYFKLYTKSKTTKEKSKQLLKDLEIEKEYNENILYSIAQAEVLEDLTDIKKELGLTEIKQQKEIPSFLKYNINGFEVLVGKNNKQNDLIISKLSKDEDIWFHTRLCAGSHVLLKVRDIEPDEQTIFECCKLARQFSSATLPSKVGVIYTKRRFIKKPPAAPLGYVIYKNEKEILI